MDEPALVPAEVAGLTASYEYEAAERAAEKASVAAAHAAAAEPHQLADLGEPGRAELAIRRRRVADAAGPAAAAALALGASGLARSKDECPRCVAGSGKLAGHLGRHLARIVGAGPADRNPRGRPPRGCAPVPGLEYVAPAGCVGECGACGKPFSSAAGLALHEQRRACRSWSELLQRTARLGGLTCENKWYKPGSNR
jgi:hypothetical protein